MDALRISVLDPEWSRQEVIERNLRVPETRLTFPDLLLRS
jgi:hypothetical protein